MFRSGFEGSEHAYADAVAIASEHANVYGEFYKSVRWRKSKKALNSAARALNSSNRARTTETTGTVGTVLFYCPYTPRQGVSQPPPSALYKATRFVAIVARL